MQQTTACLETARSIVLPDVRFWPNARHGCKTREAKITGAYCLPCKYVIHTVGPVWHGGQNGEEKILENAYRNSRQAAVNHGIRTIAFHYISAGVYCYPVNGVALAAVRTAQKFCEEHMDKIDIVRFVLFD